MTDNRVRFAHPPVVEVVCSVLFNSQTLPLQTAHFGLYWALIRDEFTQTSDNAPIAPAIEQASLVPAAVQVELGDLPPLRRVWFTNANGNNLIQIQDDRFLFNWKRALDSTEEYPSYDKIIVEFKRHLEVFKKFVADEGIGNVEFRQFELTYVNLIKPGEEPTTHYGDVLVDHFCRNDHARFLPKADLINWNTSYSLPAAQGRLHVTARTAIRKRDQSQMLRLELTARGIPSSTDGDGVVRWFDLAHEWITHGFADSTSPDFHKKWGRIS